MKLLQPAQENPHKTANSFLLSGVWMILAASHGNLVFLVCFFWWEMLVYNIKVTNTPWIA